MSLTDESKPKQTDIQKEQMFEKDRLAFEKQSDELQKIYKLEKPAAVSAKSNEYDETKPVLYNVVVLDDGIHDCYQIREVYVPKGYNGATESFCVNTDGTIIRSFYQNQARLKPQTKTTAKNVEISKQFVAACLLSMQFTTSKNFIQELSFVVNS